MINKHLRLPNLQYYQLKHVGFTLFEVTMTLVISSIVLAVAGSFISSSVNIVTQTAAGSAAINTAKTSSNNNNIVFTLLNNDFANNLGAVSTDPDGGTNLRFKILDPNNAAKIINVNYNCQIDPAHQSLLRQLDGYSQEILLTNVTACSFTYVVSTDQTTITLTYSVTVTNNNTPIVVSNVTTGPYTK